MDYTPLLYGLGGFIVSVLTMLIAFRRLPLELKKSETSLATEAYALAQQAINDRASDLKRIETLEAVIETKDKNTEGLEGRITALEGQDKVKTRTIRDLQKTVDDLIVGIDILTEQLTEANMKPKWKRKKTDELKGKEEEK